MSTHPLSIEGPFGNFADHLLAEELPDLPRDHRVQAVAFSCRRAREVPTPLQLAIGALSVGVGLATRIVGIERVTAFLRSTRLPFVSELSRMVRSLSFAFVWETWPDTSPSGAVAS